MIYRITSQTRGKKTGYYSHPKTIKVGNDSEKMMSDLRECLVGKNEKISLWELDEKTGEWVRMASREGI